MRKRFSPTEREALLAEYRLSNLTQAKFAKEKQIGKSTLGNWLRRQRREGKTKKPRLREVPLVSVLGGGWWGAEVVSPHGWTVRLSAGISSAQAAQLIRALPC